MPHILEYLTLCAILKDFLFHYSKLSGNDFPIIYLTLFSCISYPIWWVLSLAWDTKDLISSSAAKYDFGCWVFVRALSCKQVTGNMDCSSTLITMQNLCLKFMWHLYREFWGKNPQPNSPNPVVINLEPHILHRTLCRTIFSLDWELLHGSQCRHGQILPWNHLLRTSAAQFINNQGTICCSS